VKGAAWPAADSIEAIQNMNSFRAVLSPAQRKELLSTLKARFEKNINRHQGLAWAKAQAKLEAIAEKLRSLNEMERTGGEPEVIGEDKRRANTFFCDCSAESPEGRRSLCYHREARDARKEHKPKGNATDVAAASGALFVIAATAPFSCITTVRNLTMRLGDSVAR
jgi:Protein of unknown function (DUF4256)